ncbi:hypothetical protein GJ654_15040 [Rhodoblastus acidophilus]|uniref:Uncharacterized protein n=1 Tax=Rhodoblastus acidophilus TaxID=1074 RepID=A0A6N8DSY0_RHOAC|nr:hypothetical protein [Rhodoblastus acidophilus]MCW2274523.1 hypothetical protein [Rhodoblastus acidophilus]MTV32303.1 hypothetical protein [Rhodoblastus acidophilus]
MYIWDLGIYWDAFKVYGREAAAHGPWLKALRQSVAHDEYNAAAVVPLIPVYRLFGGDRLVYVTAVAALYLTPAAMIAAHIARRSSAPGWWTAALALFAALFSPLFWNPTIRGYLDMIGLIPFGAATWIVLRSRFLTRASVYEALGFGLAIWLTFVFRRWYAFSLIALIAASLAVAVALLAANRPFSLAAARRTALIYVLAGVACLSPALAFQAPLLLQILDTNYALAFSAYQASAADQLRSYYANFGAFMLAFAAVGLGYDLWRRRFESLFCAAVAVLTGVLFARVQAPSPQHFLPVAFLLFPAYFSGLSLASSRLVLISRPLICGLIALNFLTVYLKEWPAPANFLRAPFPEARFLPLRINHFDEVQRLLRDLKALPRDGKITVFASSLLLSESLFYALDEEIRPRLLWPGHVDLRDRFHWEVLRGDYFVVGAPTPTDLPRSSQRVITYPAEEIANGTGIGAGLERIVGPYTLGNEALAYVYKRNAPIAADAVAGLAERLYAHYPEWRRDDQGDVGLLLAVADITGDAGRVRKLSHDALSISPGNGDAVEIAFRNAGVLAARRAVVSVDAEVLRRCPDADGVSAELKVEGAASRTVDAPPGGRAEFDLPADARIALSVGPRANTHCDDAVIQFVH